MFNPVGDEGLATLVAPPPAAGALPLLTGVLTKLKVLSPSYTQVTDAGCAALAAALQSGALPALETLHLYGIPASAAAKAAVQEALSKLENEEPDSESESESEEDGVEEDDDDQESESDSESESESEEEEAGEEAAEEEEV